DDVVFTGVADIHPFNPRHIFPRSESGAVQASIINRLKPVRYTNLVTEYYKHLMLHMHGTGDWAFSTEAYQQWHFPRDTLAPGSNILWIRGVPGSGKSCLASALITKLQLEDVPVLYFFFRHGHNPEVALRDWLAQVLPFSPPLQTELKPYIRGHASQPDVFLSLGDLFRFLNTAMSHLDKVYIVADALDEMDQESLVPFLQHVNYLAQWRPVQIKFIMASRLVERIEKMLRSVRLLDISLGEPVKSNVAAYVQRRLAMSSMPVEHHSRIAEIILRQSGGLFLYAKLATEHILERPELDIGTLAAIPAGLSAMYAEMLQEQFKRPGVPPELPRLILKCVTHATRPLRLRELSDLINVTQDTSAKGDLGTTKNIIRSICGPLLQILPDQRVHVVHHTLIEFLNGTMATRDMNSHDYSPLYLPGPTHNHMALLCISYLGAGCLDGIHLEIDGRNDYHYITTASRQVSPFAHYAAANWHVHARKSMLAGHDQSEVNIQILDLFKTKENLKNLGLLAGGSKPCEFTPLGLATSLRLTSLVKEVLERMKLDNVPVAMEGPLLHAAKANEDVETIKLLLEHGADPTVYDDYGLSPLHRAVWHNQHQVIKVLLDAGANPFLPLGENKRVMGNPGDSKSTRSPAHHVFSAGEAALVSLFLPHLKTVKSANWSLGRAVKYQRHDTVQRLLQHRLVDVNAKVGFFTPLFTACWLRDANNIGLLLKAGADINVVHCDDDDLGDGPGQKGFNVLHALAGLGDFFTWPPSSREHLSRGDDATTRKCFKLVLDAGAKLDQADIKGQNPLHVAQDAIAVECLLDAGIDSNVTNQAGKTLLHSTWDESIIRMLALRVDINAKAQYRGATPLLSVLMDDFCANESRITKAFLLLDLGADAAASDGQGNGSLHYVVSRIMRLGSAGLSLLERLLAGGADVNLKNDKGQTPLHWSLPGSSSKYGSYGRADGKEVLKMLFDAGADLEAKDNEGRTALFQMMSHDSGPNAKEKIKVAELMMDLGAMIGMMDLKGRNLLHCAVSYRWPEIELIKFLVSHGIDPQKTDNKGNTLWHSSTPRLARAPPMLEFVSELVLLGVDPTKANSDGEFPLHIVANDNTERWTNADDACFFDHFIGLGHHSNSNTKINIDCVDNNGVTPLHLASTFSEYLTHRLLGEGADPTRQTSEGLTVLHLAARSRQTNTMGLLLAWFKSSHGKKGMPQDILNARDRLHRSALYYACASGRPETVQLLLDAGASKDADLYAASPWAGCVALQDEEKAKWRWSDSGIYGLEEQTDAAGVLISDTLRTKLDVGGGTYHMRFPFTEQRLDEIVDLLILHGGRVSHDKQVEYVHRAIASAVEKQFDHATECLLRARERLGVKEPYVLDAETSTRLLSRLSETINPRPGDSVTTALMADRRYSLATAEIVKDPSGTMLHRLVMGRFAKLLQEVATQDAVLIRVREESEPTPLLATACRQAQWNMDVVRLLVEKYKVDLNGKPNIDTGSQALCYANGNQYQTQPLHTLFRGGRWWQVNEALPYLLSRGASTETQDSGGRTPLAAALEAINGPHFSRKAVETLLQFNDNPNATDNQGRTCLSMAGGNRDAYKLLISHGAIVTPSTMGDIIKRRDIALLKSVLASGVDPNMRQVPDIDGKKAGSAWKSDPSDNLEHYPLELVTMHARSHSSGEEEKVSEKMFELLLEHGANPSARYKKTTVMHRLLDINNDSWIGSVLGGNGRILNLLLQNSNLDLEAQDYKNGMTVLHVVASKAVRQHVVDNMTLLQMLIDTGVNVHARDKAGMTVLHHLITGSHSPYQDVHLRGNPDIKRVIRAAPELLHAIDNRGRTPLHTALDCRFVNVKDVYELIEAGSDITVLVESTGGNALHLLFGQPWVVNLNGEVRKCDEDKTSVLQRLVEGGVNVNARNKQGKTPIFGLFAHAEVNIEVVPQERSEYTLERQLLEDMASVEKESLIWQFLDRLGVDWTAESKWGTSLLHVVAECGNYGEMESTKRVQRFQFLMSKGLDAMKKDNKHRTPLDVAAAAGREEILALFKS
ncbi:ankyrin repeat-containing domain protein, partial [Dactylonectria estremocensis]